MGHYSWALAPLKTQTLMHDNTFVRVEKSVECSKVSQAMTCCKFHNICGGKMNDVYQFFSWPTSYIRKSHTLVPCSASFELFDFNAQCFELELKLKDELEKH